MGSNGLRVGGCPVGLPPPSSGAFVFDQFYLSSCFFALFFAFARALGQALCAVTLSELLPY
jgi:hypothetical protein